jgi:hypothetical protein
MGSGNHPVGWFGWIFRLLLRNLGKYYPLLPEEVVAALVQCQLLISGKKTSFPIQME